MVITARRTLIADYPAVRNDEGEWKYDLFLITDSVFDEIGYCDLEISMEREAFILTLYPRLANDGYEIWEESEEDAGYEPFEGGFDNEAIKLVGNNAVIYITDFFTINGNQYMLGTIWLSEEVSGDFWMYRGH